MTALVTFLLVLVAFLFLIAFLLALALRSAEFEVALSYQEIARLEEEIGERVRESQLEPLETTD